MKRYWRAVLRRQWPVLTVAAIGVVALILVAAGFWRRGALMIGIGVRSRVIDVSTMVVLCAAVIYIAWTIDPLGTS